MPRTRSPIARILLIAVATCAMGTVAAVQQPATPKHVETRPAASAGKPESRVEGDETLQNAVAAVVVAAMTEQFGNRTISVKLDSADVQIASLRDRVVSGRGRVQIGAGEDWIGFRYRTLYDTLHGSAGYPQVTLGGGASNERVVPNDATLVQELDARVAAELDREFDGQPVRLQLDEITTLEASTRYLRIDAQGIADFGREGSTSARVDALYDRKEKSWLRVNYELGPAVGLDTGVSIAGQ
jgi:hypothetical protein